MSKFIFKLFSLMIVAALVLPVFTTRIYALNSIPERDKLRNTVVICDDFSEKVVAIGEGLSVQDVSTFDSDKNITNNSVVIDYDVLKNSSAILETLKNALFDGVAIYIRTPNGDIERERIKNLFGLQDLTGKIEYTSDKVSEKKNIRLHNIY